MLSRYSVQEDIYPLTLTNLKEILKSRIITNKKKDEHYKSSKDV